MTRNTILRLSVFFLGIPLLGVAAVAFPDHNLPLFGLLVVIAASAVAAYEAAFFFPSHTRDYPGNQFVIPALGALVPGVGFASLYLPSDSVIANISPATVLLITLTLTTSAIMAVQVLKRRETEIFQIITVVNTHVFLLIYPGLFTWHVVQIISLSNPSVMLIVFVLAVYMNDSMAWLVGRLLGPLTRKAGAPPPVAISPNKSMVGFIGGFLASPLVILIAGASTGAFPRRRTPATSPWRCDRNQQHPRGFGGVRVQTIGCCQGFGSVNTRPWWSARFYRFAALCGTLFLLQRRAYIRPVGVPQ